MENITHTKTIIPLFDRANSQLQNPVFQNSHYHFAFLPVMNKSLHIMLVKICMAIRIVACLLCCCHHCWNAPLAASLHSDPLVGLHQHSASINKCQWEQFFLHGGIKWHPFWFIRTSMSEAIWSGCPSAAICHTATKHYGILVGRFNLYCHTTNICLRCWSCAKILT